MSEENSSDDDKKREIEGLGKITDFYLPAILGFLLLILSIIGGLYYNDAYISSLAGVFASGLLVVISLQRAYEYEHGFRDSEINDYKYPLLVSVIIVILVFVVPKIL